MSSIISNPSDYRFVPRRMYPIDYRAQQQKRWIEEHRKKQQNMLREKTKDEIFNLFNKLYAQEDEILEDAFEGFNSMRRDIDEFFAGQKKKTLNQTRKKLQKKFEATRNGLYNIINQKFRTIH